jgi:hypothetical protein
MNKKTGLFMGGLVLLLVSTGSATATTLLPCGTVSSAGNGLVAFVNSTSGTDGTALSSGGEGIITCDAFTVPPGQTLTGIVIEVIDNATGSTGANSQITWTWGYSGEALTPTPSGTFSEQGTAGLGFGSCSGGGTLACNATANFVTVASLTGGEATGTFTFTVAPTVTGVGGAGLGETGADSAEVLIGFNTVAPTPEPASLLLIASGLFSLGIFARRRRRNL